MSSQFWARRIAVGSIAALVACGGETLAPSNKPAARLDAVVDLSRTGTVGAAVAGGLIVKASDANGHPVEGAKVLFTVTIGNGSVSPGIATTNSSGEATAQWTLGTIAGSNEVTANVDGVTTPVTFEANGAAGPVASITFANHNVRLVVGVDTARVSASALDAFGNVVAPTPTLVVRDPTLITIDNSGIVHASRRGSSTYVVASTAGKSDSALVTVLAAGQSPCTAAAAPVSLAVGQVITDNVSGAGFCVHADNPNAEYAIVPYFEEAPGTTIQIEVKGLGVTPPPLASASLATRIASSRFSPTAELPVPNDAFELRRRARERAELTGRVEAARSWGRTGLRPRRDVIAAAAATALPAVGDLINLNANVSNPCDEADMRPARVVAITDKAIVVADTSNPAGGFTNDEYKSLGTTFDTLMDPTDRAAFGNPSDIDGNGRVIMFFTRAVNRLSDAGSGGIVLGLFFSRDLFPKTGTSSCKGSNVGEMFYLLVPDTAAVAGPNRLTKSQVVILTNGTAAHEYQHLINASRRLYVNNVGPVFEEPWLDEGLAHIAEDINFWKSTGLSPRSNFGNPTISDPRYNNAYQTFVLNNFRRYATYLLNTAIQGPIGSASNDTDLQTRGAIWSFLRYAADHLPAGTEDAFWFNLVNSHTAGVANLTSALGTAPNAMMRDWAISVFMDDNAPNVNNRFLQPSWNLRDALTGGGVSLSFPLATRQLTDGATTIVPMFSNGVSFLRFSVPNGQDALLTVNGSGGVTLPSAVQLALVRVR